MALDATPTRRDALARLAGVSLFPLVAPACVSAPLFSSRLRVVGTRFLPMPAPGLADPEAMARTEVSSRFQSHFEDGSTVTADIGYRVLFPYSREGCAIPC